MKSKEYRDKLKRIIELHALGKTHKEIAKKLIEEGYEEPSVKEDSVRRKVGRALEGHPALLEEAKKVGIDPEDVKNYWYKGKNFSIHVSSPREKVTWEDIKEEIIKDMKDHAPKYDYKRPTGNSEDPCCLVIDPADLHIGKYADQNETSEEYDTYIAYSRCRDGVDGILKKSEGFNVQKIVFIGGNDILHVDGPGNKTTSGTPQDVDLSWNAMYRVARTLYVNLLEQLSAIAPVHFIHTPSNHDYVSGFFLSEVIKTWFANHDGITFDVSMAHRKYYQYGNNLIGVTHGDGAKEKDLPMLMAVEAKGMWSECDHRYIYTHHIHHKTSKDYPGVTVESLRSPSATDSWHHKMGYQHSPQAIEGFVHSYENGQVARISHIFDGKR